MNILKIKTTVKKLDNSLDKNFTFITMLNFIKPFLKLLMLLIVCIIIVISLKGCASMGTNPDKDNVARFKHSMHYDANKKKL